MNVEYSSDILKTNCSNNLKGLCKAKSLHLHRAVKSKNSPLKSMTHTRVGNN